MDIYLSNCKPIINQSINQCDRENPSSTDALWECIPYGGPVLHTYNFDVCIYYDTFIPVSVFFVRFYSHTFYHHTGNSLTLLAHDDQVGMDSKEFDKELTLRCARGLLVNILLLQHTSSSASVYAAFGILPGVLLLGGIFFDF